MGAMKKMKLGNRKESGCVGKGESGQCSNGQVWKGRSHKKGQAGQNTPSRTGVTGTLRSKIRAGPAERGSLDSFNM